MKRTRIVILLATAIVLMASCTKTEKNYYPDGSLQSVIHYKFGKEHGKSVYLYQWPNTVEIEVEMKNGKRNGNFYRYFKNGNLDTYCVYVNDSIEGMETMYTPNGEKSEENTYVRGKKNGAHREYHLNGQLKAEGTFKNDLFDGQWTYYDDRGIIVGEGNFENGNGVLTAYDAKGHTAMVTHYIRNMKDGKEVFYTPSGQIYKETVYKENRIVSQQVDSTLIP